MFARAFNALNPRSVGIRRPKYGEDGEATYHCGFPLRNAPVEVVSGQVLSRTRILQGELVPRHVATGPYSTPVNMACEQEQEHEQDQEQEQEQGKEREGEGAQEQEREHKQEHAHEQEQEREREQEQEQEQ